MTNRDPLVPFGVLILGATSSIAIATMRRLAAQNAHFMLVARNSDRLTAVAQDLHTRGALAVDTWVMDLDDTAAHPEMLAAAAERLGRIDLALIAHGVLGDQQAAEADFHSAAAILHTNFISAVSLLTWLGNYFQAQRAGTGVLGLSDPQHRVDHLDLLTLTHDFGGDGQPRADRDGP